ncbi:MAG TPA: DUF3597 domain-containing protein [Thermoanaerobaculia bacterium]|nr:DUF3597 domain-containing protein [Thermoanaerobaculia bacterium]
MGMFSDLMQKVFRSSADAEKPEDAARGGRAPESRVQAAERQGVPVGQAVPNKFGAPGASGSTTLQSEVDIAANLDRLAADNAQKLDWKHSIVDLMKLVGMDSSLSARKELADDLKYTGDKNDSAAMNIWLHKEVMRKLAANGGRVPPELLS